MQAMMKNWMNFSFIDKTTTTTTITMEQKSSIL
jgi:hypothetical protein